MSDNGVAGRPRRVRVVGTTGAGKSTFAMELARRTGLPHHQLDGVLWRDDWKQVSKDELEAEMQRLFDLPEWIVDGNDPLHIDVAPSLDRADLVIWLDPARPIVFWRVLKRSVRRAITRETLWGTNNRESFRLSFFSRESVILWSMRTFTKRRRNHAEAMRTLGPRMHRVRTKRDAARLLDELTIRT